MPDQTHFCEGERRYTITSLMRRFHIKTKTSPQVTSHIDHCQDPRLPLQPSLVLATLKVNDSEARKALDQT